MFISINHLELFQQLNWIYNTIIVSITLFLFVFGGYRAFQFLAQPKDKEIILNDESIIIPEKDSSNLNVIKFSNIKSLDDSEPVKLDLITDNKKVSIDLSWIANNKELKEFHSLMQNKIAA